MIKIVKEEVIEDLLDRYSAFDLYEDKDLIDDIIDSTERVLRLHGVVRSVWLVQHKETLINHGTFSTEEKARKYFNYNDDSFACVEVEIA